MKVAPPRLPTAASPTKVQSEGAAVPITPTPPASPSPVPIPYPSTSDAFERVKPNPLGALLGGAATQVDDDAQLANVELQNVLQKQQQVLQTMSNISKRLHDTATAVTRKLGG